VVCSYPLVTAVVFSELDPFVAGGAAITASPVDWILALIITTLIRAWRTPIRHLLVLDDKKLDHITKLGAQTEGLSPTAIQFTAEVPPWRLSFPASPYG
jgi:hypothetical protein